MSWMLAAFWLLSVYRTRWQGLPDGWSHNLEFYLGVYFMFFVGIDIGKNNHVASMMDESGKVVFKAFSFPNTSDGGEAPYALTYL